MSFNVQQLPKKPLAFVLAMSLRHWHLALGAFVCVGIARILTSFLVYVLKLIVDSILLQESSAEILGLCHPAWFWAGTYMMLIFVSEVFWRGSGFVGMQWITRTTAHVYTQLFAYLTGHGSQYFSDRFAGSLTSKITNIKDGIENISDAILWNYWPLAIQLIASTGLIAIVQVKLAIFFVLWIGVLIFVNYCLVQKTKKLSSLHAKASSDLYGQMVDITSNIGLVHFFTRRRAEMTYLARFIEEDRKTELRSWFYAEWILVFNNFLQIFLVGGILLGGIYLWRSHQASAGDIVMLIQLTMGILNSLLFIGISMDRFMQNIGKIKEGVEEIIVDHDIQDVPHAPKLQIARGDISFRSVEFAYPKGERVFSKLDLEIPAGQKVGIVGKSGVGKTTLIQLLLRSYDVDSGEILIDGHKIARVQQDSLREQITFVSQEPLLFHRTIRENIGYGQENASIEQIKKASKMAHAHEFIVASSDQYETYVGERGIKLSGGQKQRIAIARAMLKDAPILILDEATSALDSESELLVQEALQTLMQNKTVLAIAHRLSTLRAMDRILVLDEGRIVEDGTHKSLLTRKGLYCKLWHHQSGGFIED